MALALAEDHAVTGIDPSAAQARRFRRRAHGEAVSARAAGENLPFRSGSFDTVYSSCVFKHWGDPGEALSECARVTRHGGRLITVEIDGGASPSDFRRFADRSRVPLGLRSGYVRFAMRTVVGVAPGLPELRRPFEGLPVESFAVEPFPDMPFLIATATIA